MRNFKLAFVILKQCIMNLINKFSAFHWMWTMYPTNGIMNGLVHYFTNNKIHRYGVKQRCENKFTIICTQYLHYPIPGSLTHWGRDKMAAIFRTTYSKAFSWMKIYKFLLRFHWSLFPRSQLTIFQYWFRLWLGASHAISHYLHQWWLDYICVTRLQWVNNGLK